MRAAIVGLTLLASACVSVQANVTTAPDATLLALQNARVRECPADRIQAGARNEGFGAQSGVVGEDLALTPVASDPTKAQWQRDLTVSHVKLATVAEEQGRAADAAQHWRATHDALDGMKKRGMRLSPEDEGYLAQLKQKLGL